MYVTEANVLLVAGITTTEVPTATVTLIIQGVEGEVDRFTNTTYWNTEDSGTADAGAGDDELDDATKTWTADAYNTDHYCWIYSGTGSGQIRQITDTATTKLTLDSDWTTNPDATSLYRIMYTAQNPYISSSVGLYDGDETDTFFLPKYPLRLLESVTIDSTSVTPSYIYQYPKQGRLVLGTDDVEVSYWSSKQAQKNVIAYWWGVYPIPREIVRYTLVCAAIRVLQTQMGGTHNIPSTYSLPEGSVTIGQAYINIETTRKALEAEKKELEKILIRYMSVSRTASVAAGASTNLDTRLYR